MEWQLHGRRQSALQREKKFLEERKQPASHLQKMLHLRKKNGRLPWQQNFASLPAYWLHGSFIIGSASRSTNWMGLHGAGGETVAEAITIIVSKQNSLSVYNADGSLVAGIGAKTAAITFFLVYLNNSSDHKNSPFKSKIHL